MFRVKEIDSNCFPARLNILFSKRASVDPYKDPEMTFKDNDIALIFSNKTVNLLSVILRKRSKQTYIKKL